MERLTVASAEVLVSVTQRSHRGVQAGSRAAGVDQTREETKSAETQERRITGRSAR